MKGTMLESFANFSRILVFQIIMALANGITPVVFLNSCSSASLEGKHLVIAGLEVSRLYNHNFKNYML